MWINGAFNKQNGGFSPTIIGIQSRSYFQLSDLANNSAWSHAYGIPFSSK